ncbi:MAG: acetyl-CoA acetyltransferase family protein [Planctomycetota bacterium]|jgi:acetyl-CoA acetyltransferase family protein
MTTLREAPPIVLAAGLRSPFVRSGGVFQGEDPGHLGARLCRELFARTGVDPSAVDEMIVGSVGPPHDQANVARVIGLRAGLPWSTPARTVARNCASGIEAVTSAVTEILSGRGDFYMCMGVEIMSGYPLIVGKRMTRLFANLFKAKTPGAKLAALSKFRPGDLAPRVALLEGLMDPVSGLLMGQTAEVLARDFGITREESDRYAVQSHHRARAARDTGRFEREILPVHPLGARKPGAAIANDDNIRDDQSETNLAKLRPYFEKPDGVVTVGNACGITDGAAALFVGTEQRARELGLKPLARIRSYAWAGLDPARMGLGPVYSTALALRDAGCNLSDIGTIELNEAFATQVLACKRAFESDTFAREQLGLGSALGELDLAKTNVNGGAIALGHPVGATGARLLLTTAHEMIAGDHELGLATLCIGGGQGGAVVLERIAA